MSKGFNLTAELNLRGPTNIRTVVADIRRQVGSVSVNITPSVNRQSIRNVANTIRSQLSNLVCDVRVRANASSLRSIGTDIRRQLSGVTANVNVRANQTSIRSAAADIRRQLGSISTNVNVTFNTSAVTAYSGRLGALNNNLNQITASATNATAAINSLTAAMRGAATAASSINNASVNMGNVGGAASRAGASVSLATNEIVEFGRQSGLAVRRFSAFSTVTGIIYGITNAINQGVKAFIDFDLQLTRIAQVTGDSKDKLGDVANTITNLSTTLGVSSGELTKTTVTLAQAGLTAKDTATALKALALSALAPSFDDMNQTVEGSIALMRQFGISANQLEMALGSVNAVSAKFAVEASDIITAIQRTGGVFAAASKGVSSGTDALNEFIAVFTSIRATTRESAETIATGLRTIFTRIQRAGTIEALKEFGVTLTDLEGKFVGPYIAVQRLSEGLSRLDPRDLKFSQIVEELGGFRQIGKVLPLIQQFATAQDALKVAQQGQGSLATDAAKGQLALAVQIQKVREEFQALIRSIGDTSSFQAIVRVGLDLASALIKVADATKGVLPLITMFAAFKGISAASQYIGGFGQGIRGRAARGAAEGGRVYAFASGGLVPGSGKGDKIPALLEPGEVVMSNLAGNKYGRNNLLRMNRYAAGGSIINNIGGVPASTNIIKGKDNKKVGFDNDSYHINADKQIIKIVYNKKDQKFRANRKVISATDVNNLIHNDPKAYETWENISAQVLGAKRLNTSDPNYPIDLIRGKKLYDAKFRPESGFKERKAVLKALSYRLEQTNSGYKYNQSGKTIKLSKFLGQDLTEGPDNFQDSGSITFVYPEFKDIPANLPSIQEGMRIRKRQAENLPNEGAGYFARQAVSTIGDRQYISGNKDIINLISMPKKQKYASGGIVQKLMAGGELQKAVRRIGIIDSDVIRSKASDPRVIEGMKLLGAITEADYAIKLSKMAGEFRQSGQLGRFSVLAGSAANRKSSLVTGRGANDNASLRQTTRTHILHPDDLKSIDQVMSVTTTLKDSKLEYMGMADRLYVKDSSTEDEQKLVKLFEQQRNTKKDSTLYGREAGTTSSLSPDYGLQTASLLSQFGSVEQKNKKGKVMVLGEKTDDAGNPLYRIRRKRENELPELVSAKGQFPAAISPITRGHVETAIGTLLSKVKEKYPDATHKDLLLALAPDLSLSGGQQGREHGARYGEYPASFRRDLAKLVLPDMMISSTDRASDTGINPRIAEIEKGMTGRRQFAIMEKNAPVVISKAPHENPEGVMGRYRDAGLDPYNIARSADMEGDSISGTATRKAAIDKDYAKLDLAVLPQVGAALKANQPQLKNRNLMVPLVQQAIDVFVQANSAKINEQVDQILKGAPGGPFSRMTPKFKETNPSLVTQIKKLRQARDGLEREAFLEPAHDLLRIITSKHSDLYGLDVTRQSPIENMVSADDAKQHIIEASRSSSFFKPGLSFDSQLVAPNARMLDSVQQIMASQPDAPVESQSLMDSIKDRVTKQLAAPKGAGDLPTDSKTIASSLRGTIIPSGSTYGMFAGKPVDIDMAKKVWRQTYAGMSEEKTASYTAVRELLKQKYNEKLGVKTEQLEQAITESQMFGLAGLLPIGHSQLSGPFVWNLGKNTEGKDVSVTASIIERGISKQAEQAVLAMQARGSQNSELFADDLGAIIGKKTKNTLSKSQLEIFGQGNIEGSTAEQGLARLHSYIDNISSRTRPIDFPDGLGDLAKLFPGILPNIPTELKRTISSDSRSDAIGEFQRYLRLTHGIPELDNIKKAQPKTAAKARVAAMSFGGSVQKFDTGGTIPALVSNGEAFVPPETARKIGYSTLNRMNQADRNGMGRFAEGGISVFKGPGSGTSDSIPAHLPVGGFVIRAAATKALGFNRGGAVQRFAFGGTPRAVPNISGMSDTQALAVVGVVDTVTDQLKGLASVLEELGVRSSESARIVQSGTQATYQQAIRATEVDIRRARLAGASAEQIANAENQLANIRRQAQQDIQTRRTLGGLSGTQLQQIESRAETIRNTATENMRNRLARRGMSQEDIDARLQENAGAINRASYERASRASGVDLRAAGLRGDDAQRFIRQSMGDPRVLQQMDAQYAVERRRAIAAEVRASGDRQRAARIRAGLDNETNRAISEEIRARREVVNNLARQRGQQAPGGDPSRSRMQGVMGFAFGLQGLGSLLAQQINASSSASNAATAGGIQGAVSGLSTGAMLTSGIQDMLGSRLSPAMSKLLRGFGIAATAAAAVGQAFIDSHNAVIEFEKNLQQKKLETALSDSQKLFEKLNTDIKNIDIQKSLTSKLAEAGDAVIAGIELNNSRAKAMWVNLLDVGTLKGNNIAETLGKNLYGFAPSNDSDAMSQRSEILEKKGIFNYLRSTDAFGEGDIGRRKEYESLIPEKARENSKSFAETSKLTTDLIGAKIQGGASVEDIFKDPAWSKQAEVIARSNVAVEQEILSIRNRADISNLEKEARIKNIIAINAEEAIRQQASIVQRQMQMKSLEDTTNVYTRSLERMFQNMEQSIGRASFSLEQMSKDIDLVSDSLQGQAKVGGIALTAINALQNPRAYSDQAVSGARNVAAESFGIRSPEMVSLLGVGEKIESTVMSTINKSVDKNPGITNEALGIVVSRDVKSALADLSLPADLVDKLSGEVGNVLKDFQKSGEDKLDYTKLSEKLAQLNKVVDSSKRAQEVAIKALELYQNALNTYTQNINKTIDLQISANQRLRKATDIVTDSELSLAKTLGKNISLENARATVNSRVSARTGGVTNPNDIFDSINKLENTRTVQQAEQRSAAERGVSGQADFIKFTKNLADTNVSLRENIEALKYLADNTDIAASAMEKIQEAQQKASGRASFIEKLVTSTPEELDSLSGAFQRLQNNANGQINTINRSIGAQRAYYEALQNGATMMEAMKAAQGAFVNERKETLGALNDILPFLGNGQQAGNIKANVLESMMQESGIGMSPLFQQVLNTLRNPEMDPATQAAIAEYREGNNLQARANALLAQLDSNLARDIASQSAKVLANALSDVKINFETKELADIVNHVRSIDNKMPGAGGVVPVGKATGGIIYAAAGQAIDFKSQGTDTVPAMLTPGEFVVNRAATQRNLPLLHAINSNKYSSGGPVRYYSSGGYVSQNFKSEYQKSSKDLNQSREKYIDPESAVFKDIKSVFFGPDKFVRGAESTNIKAPLATGSRGKASLASIQSTNSMENLYLGEAPGIIVQQNKDNQDIFNYTVINRPRAHLLDPLGYVIDKPFDTKNITKNQFADYRDSFLEKLRDNDIDLSTMIASRPAVDNFSDIPQAFISDNFYNPNVISNNPVGMIVTRNKNLGAIGWNKQSTDHPKVLKLFKFGSAEKDATIVSDKDYGLYKLQQDLVMSETSAKDRIKLLAGDNSWVADKDNIDRIIKTQELNIENIKKSQTFAFTDPDPTNAAFNNLFKAEDSNLSNLRQKLEMLYSGAEGISLMGNELSFFNPKALTDHSEEITLLHVLNSKYKPILDKSLNTKEQADKIHKTFPKLMVGGAGLKNLDRPEDTWARGYEFGIYDANLRTPLGMADISKMKTFPWVANADPSVISQDIQAAIDNQSEQLKSKYGISTKPVSDFGSYKLKLPNPIGDVDLPYHMQYTEYTGPQIATDPSKADSNGFNLAAKLDKVLLITPNNENPFSPYSQFKKYDYLTAYVNKKLTGDEIFDKAHVQLDQIPDFATLVKGNIDRNQRDQLKENIKNIQYNIDLDSLTDHTNHPILKNIPLFTDSPVEKKTYAFSIGEYLSTVADKAFADKDAAARKAAVEIDDKGQLAANVIQDNDLPRAVKDLAKLSLGVFGRRRVPGLPGNWLYNSIRGLLQKPFRDSGVAKQAAGYTSNIFNNFGAYLSKLAPMTRNPNIYQQLKELFTLGSGAAMAFAGLASGDTRMIGQFTKLGLNAEDLFRTLGGASLFGRISSAQLSGDYKAILGQQLEGAKIKTIGSNGTLSPAKADKAIPEKYIDLVDIAFNPYNEFPSKDTRKGIIGKLAMDMINARDQMGLPYFDSNTQRFLYSNMTALYNWYGGNGAWEGQDYFFDKNADPDNAKRTQTVIDSLRDQAGQAAYSEGNIAHNTLGFASRYGNLPTDRWFAQRREAGLNAEAQPNKDNEALRFATGGMVYAQAGQYINFQPRGTDTVPAMLTPGEFVVNRAATQQNLPLLKAINSGASAYSNGGVVYAANGSLISSQSNSTSANNILSKILNKVQDNDKIKPNLNILNDNVIKNYKQGEKLNKDINQLNTSFADLNNQATLLLYGLNSILSPSTYNAGGVVYASNGMMINYQPRGTDTVPAMLTPGEFVVNAKATAQHLPLLRAINQSKGGSIKGFAEGGVVYAAEGFDPSKLPKSIKPIDLLSRHYEGIEGGINKGLDQAIKYDKGPYWGTKPTREGYERDIPVKSEDLSSLGAGGTYGISPLDKMMGRPGKISMDTKAIFDKRAIPLGRKNKSILPILEHEATHAAFMSGDKNLYNPKSSVANTKSDGLIDENKWKYLTLPDEIDVRLAEVKRLYAREKGILVTSPEIARDAWEYYKTRWNFAGPGIPDKMKPEDAATLNKDWVWYENDRALMEQMMSRMPALMNKGGVVYAARGGKVPLTTTLRNNNIIRSEIFAKQADATNLWFVTDLDGKVLNTNGQIVPNLMDNLINDDPNGPVGRLNSKEMGIAKVNNPKKEQASIMASRLYRAWFNFNQNDVARASKILRKEKLRTKTKSNADVVLDELAYQIFKSPKLFEKSSYSTNINDVNNKAKKIIDNININPIIPANATAGVQPLANALSLAKAQKEFYVANSRTDYLEQIIRNTNEGVAILKNEGGANNRKAFENNGNLRDGIDILQDQNTWALAEKQGITDIWNIVNQTLPWTTGLRRGSSIQYSIDSSANIPTKYFRKGGIIYAQNGFDPSRPLNPIIMSHGKGPLTTLTPSPITNFDNEKLAEESKAFVYGAAKSVIPGLVGLGAGAIGLPTTGPGGLAIGFGAGAAVYQAQENYLNALAPQLNESIRDTTDKNQEAALLGSMLSGFGVGKLASSIKNIPRIPMLRTGNGSVRPDLKSAGQEAMEEFSLRSRPSVSAPLDPKSQSTGILSNILKTIKTPDQLAYHGSGAGFSKVDMSKVNSGGMLGSGFYAGFGSADDSVASNYARMGINEYIRKNKTMDGFSGGIYPVKIKEGISDFAEALAPLSQNKNHQKAIQNIFASEQLSTQHTRFTGKYNAQAKQILETYDIDFSKLSFKDALDIIIEKIAKNIEPSLSKNNIADTRAEALRIAAVKARQLLVQNGIAGSKEMSGTMLGDKMVAVYDPKRIEIKQPFVPEYFREYIDETITRSKTKPKMVPVAGNPGLEILERSKGGVIYASQGTLVNYQPRGTDTVPAMLTPGEFVINAKATAQHLPLLQAINGGQKFMSKGGVAYLDKGGLSDEEARQRAIATFQADIATRNQTEIEDAKKQLEKLQKEHGTSGWFGKYDHSKQIADLQSKIDSKFMTDSDKRDLAMLTSMDVSRGQLGLIDKSNPYSMIAEAGRQATRAADQAKYRDMEQDNLKAQEKWIDSKQKGVTGAAIRTLGHVGGVTEATGNAAVGAVTVAGGAIGTLASPITGAIGWAASGASNVNSEGKQLTLGKLPDGTVSIPGTYKGGAKGNSLTSAIAASAKTNIRAAGEGLLDVAFLPLAGITGALGIAENIGIAPKGITTETGSANISIADVFYQDQSFVSRGNIRRSNEVRQGMGEVAAFGTEFFQTSANALTQGASIFGGGPSALTAVSKIPAVSRAGSAISGATKIARSNIGSGLSSAQKTLGGISEAIGTRTSGVRRGIGSGLSSTKTALGNISEKIGDGVRNISGTIADTKFGRSAGNIISNAQDNVSAGMARAFVEPGSRPGVKRLTGLGDFTLGAMDLTRRGVNKGLKIGKNTVNEFTSSADFGIFTPKGIARAGSEISSDISELGIGFRKAGGIFKQNIEAALSPLDKYVPGRITAQKAAKAKRLQAANARIETGRRSDQDNLFSDSQSINEISQNTTASTQTRDVISETRGLSATTDNTFDNPNFSSMLDQSISPRENALLNAVANTGTVSAKELTDSAGMARQFDLDTIPGLSKAREISGMADQITDLQSQLKNALNEIDQLKAQLSQISPPENFNKGGIVYASSGTLIPYQPRGTDTVPAMLTPGEFVVNAKATAQHLPLLKSINNGQQNMSIGGVVYAEDGAFIPYKSQYAKNSDEKRKAYEQEMTRRSQMGPGRVVGGAYREYRAAQTQQQVPQQNAIPQMAPQTIRAVNMAANAAFDQRNAGDVNKQLTIFGTLLTGVNQVLVQYSTILQQQIANNGTVKVTPTNNQNSVSAPQNTNNQNGVALASQNVARRNNGGLIYANTGMLIPYQPRGTDTVPAMLTPGEFVVNKQATQNNLDLLQQINSNRYNQGGYIVYRQSGGPIAKTTNPIYRQYGGMTNETSTGGGGVSNNGSIGLNLDGLSQFTSTFDKFIQQLNGLKLPEIINIEGNHKVEVTINGAAAFQGMTESVTKLVVSQVNKAMNKLSAANEGVVNIG